MVTDALIPAAGKGSRLKSITGSLPKELLPLGEGKLIDYGLKELSAAGIKHVYLIINESKAALKDYLINYNNGLKISFIYQRRLRGLADAVSLGRPYLDKKPFIILLPDNLYLNSANASKMAIDAFLKHGEDIITVIRPDKEKLKSFSKSGGIDYAGSQNNQEIIRINHFYPKDKYAFHDKETADNYITFSRYVFRPDIFKYIEEAACGFDYEAGEFDDLHVISHMLKTETILGRIIDSTGAFDCGNIKGYEACKKYIETMRQ